MYFYIILEKRQVLTMILYELKKLFSRTGGRVALGLLLFSLVISCYLAVHVYYINEEGNREYGYSAAQKLRAAQKEWAGILDEERLQAAFQENLRIRHSPEALSENERDNEIAFSRIQGVYEIRSLINESYAEGFRSYDYYLADRLTSINADDFYRNRVRLLREWLETDARDQFTEAEKDWLIRQYEELDTPFYYDYVKGWRRAMEYFPTLIMLAVMILSYLVAGIFSNEFQWKTDAVFFTSVYGRNRAVSAKVKTGFLVVTGIYWTLAGIYTAFVLAFLGADGASCPVQADMGGWKCFYHLNFLQAYALALAGGFIGCLFLSGLTMLVSAKTRSSVVAVMVPFAAVFLPSFLSAVQHPLMNHILCLLPVRLLDMGTTLGYFYLYPIGGRIHGAVPLLLILYAALSVLLFPMQYAEYRRLSKK